MNISKAADILKELPSSSPAPNCWDYGDYYEFEWVFDPGYYIQICFEGRYGNGKIFYWEGAATHQKNYNPGIACELITRFEKNYTSGPAESAA